MNTTRPKSAIEKGRDTHAPAPEKWHRTKRPPFSKGEIQNEHHQAKIRHSKKDATLMPLPLKNGTGPKFPPLKKGG